MQPGECAGPAALQVDQSCKPATEKRMLPIEPPQAHQVGSGDDAAAEQAKRLRTTGNEWLRSWAWKREHRPDKVRFDRPYLHCMRLPGGEEAKLTVHQARFKEEGFASTVWDSAIVLAKYFELHGPRFAGLRCLDLSAGCGLPGLVLAKLGASVTATDLGANLPLLRRNSEANGCDLRVREHTWGTPVAELEPPFAVVAACDVMYIAEAVEPLVASLVALSGPDTSVYISHGRNRQAEPLFLKAAVQHFVIEPVSGDELDPVYQCTDVDVLRLRLKASTAGESGSWAMELSKRAAADERAAKRPPGAGALLGWNGTAQPATRQRLSDLLLPVPAAARPAPQATLAFPARVGQALPARAPLPPHSLLGLHGPKLATAQAAPGRIADPMFYLPRPPVPRAAQPPPNDQVQLRSPGWPACSAENTHVPSQDASSPKGRGLHVMAADVREAAASGGRLSKSVESLLFIQQGASVNPAMATRNRKTELDIEEPAAAVRALVQAFEALRGELAASGGDVRADMMQVAWTAVLGGALKPAGGSAVVQLRQRVAAQPAFAAPRLARARGALQACASQAHGALTACPASGPGAAPVAVLEALQRFAVRTVLPVAPRGGLFYFPWLEAAVWELWPERRPAGLPHGAWPAVGGGAALEKALAALAAVHDALEDVAGATPEAQRHAICRSALQAAGAAVLGADLAAGAEQRLRDQALRLQALGQAAGVVRPAVERALAAAVLLRGSTHRLAAAAELTERAAWVMRLAPDEWAAAMWALLREL